MSYPLLLSRHKEGKQAQRKGSRHKEASPVEGGEMYVCNPHARRTVLKGEGEYRPKAGPRLTYVIRKRAEQCSRGPIAGRGPTCVLNSSGEPGAVGRRIATKFGTLLLNIEMFHPYRTGCLSIGLC